MLYEKPKKPRINKGVRARNKVLNLVMWEDRKRGLTYEHIAAKYGLGNYMQVRNRFRYNKFPYRELTRELNSSG